MLGGTHAKETRICNIRPTRHEAFTVAAALCQKNMRDCPSHLSLPRRRSHTSPTGVRP